MDALNSSMLTIKECRKLLGSNNKQYSDEEIESMRDLLTLLLSDIINDHKKKEHETSSINGKGIK